MTESNDLYIAYAQKFWDAGNSIVILMFGLAFGTYAVIAQSLQIRQLVRKNFLKLVVLAVIGNGLLLYVIYDVWKSETLILSMVTSSGPFLNETASAFRIRCGAFVFNLVMYIGLLFLVKMKTAMPASDQKTGSL